MSGEWHEAARAMKAANPERSNASIARELGVGTSTVWRVVNPEKATARERSRGHAKRAWDKRMRATCTRCGGQCGEGTLRVDGTTRRLENSVCDSCRTDQRVQRVLEMWRLRRDEGLLNTQIAERLGVPAQTVANEMNRLRSLGYDVPPAPYNNATTKGVLVVGPAAEALGRELRARGIHPTKTRQVITTDEDG